MWNSILIKFRFHRKGLKGKIIFDVYFSFLLRIPELRNNGKNFYFKIIYFKFESIF